jgi:galactokinase
MPQHSDWERRLEDKRARKSLVELYGEGAGSQAERYLGLARLLSADLGPGGSGSELRFYSAPGRTELGGNHTDHNRGRVLCAAVALDALACVAPSGDGIVRLRSEGFPDPIVVDLASLAPVPSERGTTAALVRGVAAALAGRGAKLSGFTGRLTSSVLQGSGLSSSAAIEVLLGTVMADLAGLEIPAVEIAKIGQYAENEYFGKPCGLMDQTASAVGGVVSIDFADPEAPKVKRVKYDFDERGYSLVVVNTGGSHADLTSDYAAVPAEMRAVAAVLGAAYLSEVDPLALVARGPEIRKACGDRAFLRALHFAGENERVAQMVEALTADEIGAYLKLVKASGTSSWELLQNLYAPAAPAEQGIPVALALSAEFIGRKGAWRVHGGGFAGTIQAYVPLKHAAAYAELMRRYFGPSSVLPISVRARGALRVLV